MNSDKLLIIFKGKHQRDITKIKKSVKEHSDFYLEQLPKKFIKTYYSSTDETYLEWDINKSDIHYIDKFCSAVEIDNPKITLIYTPNE